ncbi:phage tail sheath C-terminal domain-containing protein [Candidatus Tokpelaia sp.]|uniref:phage tail sheath C-terminal domain-containing protein n=1 Tax=Candidatus Tokpelaia sp. TaxID=2233777 RepID=UPI00123C6C95|nr:phage tail sheath C-terminal domain-containing protein [Candidatus Tokpelaia sp.]KAA6405752.1 phage tail protein [Candidatus Tokpelaia sp.]
MANFNHGVQIIDESEGVRALAEAGQTSIGAVITAPAADAKLFPLDEPVAFFTHELDKVAALGASGTGLDIVNAVKAQGIEGSLVFVRVEEKDTPEATRAAIIGSAASNTGVHALEQAFGHTGVEPGIIMAPGWTGGRLEGAKNAVADALEQVAKKLKSIAVIDTGGANKEESIEYRKDFSSRWTYLIDPYVRVAAGEEIVIKPAAPYAGAMFLLRDKTKGGVYWSPSNQDVSGILGTARPISYFDGETDHEANMLNQNAIATFIPSQVAQSATGQILANGRILWGNRTTSDDPMWAFVNVVRIRTAIEKTIARQLRPWAVDQNMTPQNVIAVMRSIQSFLDDLVVRQALLGGRVWFDREQNSNANLRAGQIKVEFDAEEVPPMESIIVGSRRNEEYFENLANNIRYGSTYQFGNTVGNYINGSY